MTNKIYDIAIIGGGPAGLTSAIYALRAGRSVVMLEKLMVGGQVSLTQDVQNYPGYSLISGFELSQKMHEQASNLGAETVYGEVSNVQLEQEIKTITTLNGDVISARAVIVATGAKARKLGIANEDDYMGAGVAYCATCDGAFYKGRDVALVGGGNTGVEDAIYLTKIVNHLTYIYNSEELVAQKISVDELMQLEKEHKNITFVNNSTVTGLVGKPTLQQIETTNLITKQKQTFAVNGLFVAIGRIPDTAFLKGIIDMDKWGYIKSNETMKTNLPGVFVAGDVRNSKLKQIVTATSDGAVAATNANAYLNQVK